MFAYGKVLLHQTITRLLSPAKGAARPSAATKTLSAADDEGLTRVSVDIPALDARNAGRFLGELSSLLLPGRRIIVSFEKVRDVDSSGLGAVIAVAKLAVVRGTELKLCAVQPRVRTLFELVGVHKVVDILNSCEESLAAFAAAGSSSVY